MRIFLLILMLGNLIYAKTYIADCSKRECTGTKSSNFVKAGKCIKPYYIGVSNVKYSWNSNEKKCYAIRIYTKKEKEEIKKKKS